jgi:hypothetical protein
MKALGPILISLAILACGSPSPGTSAPAPAPPSAPAGNAALIRNPIAAGEASDRIPAAEITFSEPEYLFGEVPQGEVIRHTFTFTNTGEVPLLVTNARSTCGCTVADYPRAPIEPGERGEVSVTFDTSNKYGLQRKPVYLIANTLPAHTTVYLQGTVLTE